MNKVLRRWLSDNNMSAEKLARTAGISISTVHRILHGAKASYNVAAALNQATNGDVDIDFLVSGCEPLPLQDGVHVFVDEPRGIVSVTARTNISFEALNDMKFIHDLDAESEIVDIWAETIKARLKEELKRYKNAAK